MEERRLTATASGCQRRRRASPDPPPVPPVPPPLPVLRPELPRVIFPSTEAPTFYNPIANSYQVLRFNNRGPPFPFDIRRARFCGSGDRGWFVLAALDVAHAYALYNLNSGDFIPLPHGFVIPTGTEEPLEFYMLAAAIWPSNPAAPPTVVAAIVCVGAQAQSTAAFWSQGSAIWFEPLGMPMVELQDLVWHGNSCYFLTSSEDIIEFWFEQGPNGNATLVHQVYNIQRREDYNMDVSLMQNLGWIKRYIVVSEGREIHMVLRYVILSAMDAATHTIRVFRLHGRAWVGLNGQLAGRMLFLGSGCSRALQVDQYRYAGAGFGESMIYFLDDHMGYITLADGRRQYRFTDMGRYSMGTRARVAWPPDAYPGNSDNAPPTWWFH